ncbi:diacylglycerol acyltransferase type 2A [Aspergillus candidus]|uniref:Diacylglycerol O-acyltransferase n=1 Tax=Aspergillus candidus TaxID=41067 RepID=A0A2I2F7V5_ASPCN|nr:DAGAT-domain-containing protein [Aspergillus candidus]PLB36709.1 DAGAT-domain-containing protein [Aspergillus candidus]
MSARSNEGHGASMENGKLDTPEDGGADTTCNRKSHLEPGGERKHGRVTAGNTREATKNKQKSGIRWAPLNVGLERRLQTFVVLCHTLTIAIFLTIFFFTCAIPLSWPFLVPYLVYISLFSTAPTSGNLSGRCNFLRSLPIWSIYASYFPARLHRSEPLLPTRKYIFGYHPHGIISHGAFAAFSTEALGFSRLFPGITNTLLTLDSNFRIPFYREYALAMGVASVSRESCENLLTKGGSDGEGMGRAITIVIGGARESLDALPHSLRLVLRRRKGFVKLAVRTGADLVPVLAFGENDLYEQVRSDHHPIIHKLQMLVKQTMGFTIPLFHARGVFNYDVGLMPYRRPLNIVVGRPIPVVQQKDRNKIDDNYIDQLHTEYVKELERLWERWRDEYAKDRVSELEIVA